MMWFSVAMLALEASGVINSRLGKIAVGDFSESRLMVTEKIEAAMDACAIVASGGDAFNVIECYRKHVATNAERLKR